MTTATNARLGSWYFGASGRKTMHWFLDGTSRTLCGRSGLRERVGEPATDGYRYVCARCWELRTSGLWGTARPLPRD